MVAVMMIRMVVVAVGKSGGGREEGAEMSLQGIYTLSCELRSDIVRNGLDAERSCERRDAVCSDGDRLQDRDHATFPIFASPVQKRDPALFLAETL